MLKSLSLLRAATALRLAVCAAGLAATGLAHAHCGDTPVSGKKYYLVNQASGLQLEVSGWSSADGAGIAQWSRIGYQNQQWTVSNMGSGLWTIRPVHSDKSLDVYGWSTSDGAEIRQWSYTGNPNQQWVFTSAGDGSYTIASNFSKKLLTVADGKAGAVLKQQADQKSSLQKWFLNPVDGQCSTIASGSYSGFMGQTKLLVGTMASDDLMKQAPFDARYRYIASNPMPDDSCTATTGCPKLCDAGAGWWGCWQWTALPPGETVRTFQKDNADAKWQNIARPRVSMWSYYVLKSTGGGENDAMLKAIKDTTLLKRYFNDWRFFLQTIGTDQAWLHVEPDFWGFVRGLNSDPHAVPAQVKAANATDCGWYEDSAAGMSRCLIAMARKYAPNAKIGLHASPWNYMQAGDSEVLGKFMIELGARDGDFLVTDPSDRDAAWAKVNEGLDKWWNDDRFRTYLAWSKALSEKVGLPTVMWQVPLGNMSQNNTKSHWQDNRVDYLFPSIGSVADAHVAALMFGTGHGDCTTPETDGGNFVNKVKNYVSNGGTALR